MATAAARLAALVAGVVALAAAACPASTLAAFSCSNAASPNLTTAADVQLSWCNTYNPLSAAVPLSSVGTSASGSRTVPSPLCDSTGAAPADNLCTFVTDVTFATSVDASNSAHLLTTFDGTTSTIALLNSTFHEAMLPVPAWPGSLATVACERTTLAVPYAGALCVYGGGSAYGFGFVNASASAGPPGAPRSRLWDGVRGGGPLPPGRAFGAAALFTIASLDAASAAAVSPHFPGGPPSAYTFALVATTDAARAWTLDAMLWLPAGSAACPPGPDSCFVTAATWSLALDSRANPAPGDLLLRTAAFSHSCGSGGVQAGSYVTGAYYGGCAGQTRLIVLGSKQAASLAVFAFSLAAGGSSVLNLAAPGAAAVLDVNAALADGSTAAITDVVAWSEVVLASPPTAGGAKPASVWVAASVAGARNPANAVLLARLPHFSDPLNASSGSYPPAVAPTRTNSAGYAAAAAAAAAACGVNTYVDASLLVPACAPLPMQWVMGPPSGPGSTTAPAAGLSVAWRAYSGAVASAAVASGCAPTNVSCLGPLLAVGTRAGLAPDSAYAAALSGGHFVLAVARTAPIVHVFHLAPLGCLPAGPGAIGVTVTHARAIAAAGATTTVRLSPNGMHMWSPFARKRMYTLSKQRLLAVCAALQTDPSNAYLAAFSADCRASPTAVVAADYVQVASVCPRGSNCPSFVDEVASAGLDGRSSEFGLDSQPCPPGSYCVGGVRISCPSGFMCPSPGMSLPVRCPSDDSGTTTCYAVGTVSPAPCGVNRICQTSGEAVFVPPNYTHVVTAINGGGGGGGAQFSVALSPCPLGSYCNLGQTSVAATAAALACPAGSYCATPDVLTPSACSSEGAYCPSASSAEATCPAGAYCPVPTVATNCSLGTYCPGGTMAFDLCPAGYFCASPKTIALCPAGAYCPEGSVEPIACGSISAWACTAGGSAPPQNFEIVVGSVVVGVLILTILAYGCRVRLHAAALRCCPACAAAAVAACCGIGARASADAPASATLRTRRLSRKALGGVVAVATAPGADAGAAAALAAMTPKSFSMSVQCVGLGLTLKGGARKAVLSDVSAILRPGRVCAVMGASGSGKTTFLTTLCGKAYYGDVTGRVLINGAPGSLTEQRFKHLVAFVPQEDVMMRDLTVAENIAFSALTRLPASTPRAAKLAFADSIVSLLGLSHIRDVRIGDEAERGISGGQRKRVNVGIQLAADPSVLLLDEPTSGLDARAALLVCNALQAIAALNITVVLVLHQPRYEIFAEFDDLVLLAAGGRTVYAGPVDDALPYMSRRFGAECPPRTNPADFLVDMASAVPPDEEWAAAHPGFTLDDLVAGWRAEQAAVAEAGAAAAAAAAGKALELVPGHNSKGSPPPQPAASAPPAAAYLSIPSIVAIAEGDDSDPEAAAVSPMQHAALMKSAAQAHAAQAHAVRAGRPSQVVPSETVALGVSSAAPPPYRPVGFWRLMALVVWRSFVQQLRHPKVVITNTALPVFAAALLAGLNIGSPAFSVTPTASGIGEADHVIARCSMALLGLSLVAVTCAVAMFREERSVYFREASELRQPAHSVAYFLGKDIAAVPTMVVGALAFTFIYHAIATPRGAFGTYLWPFLGAYVTGMGYGFLVAIVFPRSNTVVIGATIVFASVVLSGSVLSLKRLEASWVPLNLSPYLSFVRYAQEALYVQEVEPYTSVAALFGIDLSAYASEALGYSLASYARNLWILFGFGAVVHVVALLCLVFMDSSKKR